MNVPIRKAYRSLFTRSPLPQFASEGDQNATIAATDFLVKHTMGNTVPAILKKRKLKLREDASLLIVLLFREMIIVPILSAEMRTAPQVLDAMQKDLETILNNAKADRSKEISAHAILQSIETNWDELEFSTFGIWH